MERKNTARAARGTHTANRQLMLCNSRPMSCRNAACVCCVCVCKCKECRVLFTHKAYIVLYLIPPRPRFSPWRPPQHCCI